ncbi:hypothetical protein J0S82_001627 [Galemys pyrenaicus]|uniref:Uncharacterized protein n=1 Tax=Galemys pyrenaicus TaxID=202257 RepID=A0A8J5ZYH0_GALPY|nr:hypothetical protein J0S82_001627 [Galemys pyrenaicus]
MASAKKGGEEKGHSAIDRVVTRKHAITCIGASVEDLEICHEGNGRSRCGSGTRPTKAGPGIRCVLDHIPVPLPRRCDGDEDSPNGPYILLPKNLLQLS